MSSLDLNSTAGVAPSPVPAPGDAPISLAYWFFVQFFRGVGLCALPFLWTLFQIWRSQESMLYHPVMAGSMFGRRCDENPPPLDSPLDHQWSLESGEGDGGLPFEEFFVDAADGVRTHGWLIWAPPRVDASTATTIVIFHANAGNMGLRLPQARSLRKGLLANVVLWDYRGYGASTGEAREEGIRADAVALLDRLRADPRLEKQKIIFYGTSLGGAVASAAAADSLARGDAPIAGLILENTFLSISALVDVLLPQFSRFKPLVLRLKWDTYSHAHVLGTRVPVLLLSSLKDALVPPSHMAMLHAALCSAHESVDAQPAFVEPKLVRVAGAGHSDIIAVAGEAAWIGWIADFLASALQSKPQARTVSSEEAASTARAFEEVAAPLRAERSKRIANVDRFNMPSVATPTTAKVSEAAAVDKLPVATDEETERAKSELRRRT